MAPFEQNIVDKFGQEKENLPTGWPWRFFVFSLMLLGISLVSFAGLVFGYQPYLNGQIEGIDREIAQLAASVPKQDQDQLVSFYGQLRSLKSVLDKHVLGSKILPFLERSTNSRVYYNGSDLDIMRKTLTLNGVAASYDILAQQLEAFNRAPEVERFLVNNSQTSEGAIRFNVSLVLKPEIFK